MAPSVPMNAPPSDIPAGQPPTGGPPMDVIGPSPQETAILVLGILFTILTTAFVTCRIYLNTMTKGRKLGLDDGACVLGLFISIGLTALEISLRKFARHTWDIPFSWINASYNKRIYATTTLTGPSLFFPKVSLLLLFLRLFSPSKRTRWALYGAIVLAFCIYFIQIPITASYCTFSTDTPGGDHNDLKCAKAMVFVPIQGVLNVVLDLFILITPIASVARLHMSRQKKLGVLAVFATGFFAVVASIVGAAYRILMWKNLATDSSFYSMNLAICVLVETDVSLICSSMPALASLRRARPAPLPYLANFKKWVLSSMNISKQYKSKDATSNEGSKENRAEADPTYTYKMDEPHVSSQGYSELEEGRVMGRTFDGSLKSHQRDIVKSVSLHQLVETPK